MINSSKSQITLPSFTKAKSEQHFIKDWNFYKSKEFIWNNKARVSAKNYEFYHKQIDENLPLIDNLKRLEEEDKQIYEENKKHKYALNILKCKTKLSEIKSLNQALQAKSGQFSDPSAFQSKFFFEGNGNDLADALPRRLTTATGYTNSEFKWNKLEQASKKQIEMVIRPATVKYEEKAIEEIKKRVEYDKFVENLRKNAIDQKHHEIRALFLSQHESNIAFEKKVGLIPKDSPNGSNNKISSLNQLHSSRESNTNQLPTSASRFERCETGVSHRTKLWSPHGRMPEFHSKFGRTITESKLSARDRSNTDNNIHTQIIEKLATIKKEYEPENEFDRCEYTGMLIKKADANLVYQGNNLYDKLTQSSKIFNQALVQDKQRKLNTNTSSAISRRNHSQMSNISNDVFILRDGLKTQLSEYERQKEKDARLNINLNSPGDGESAADSPLQDKNVNEEIEQFEKIFSKSGKRNGYPRIALDQAKGMLNIKDPQETQKDA